MSLLINLRGPHVDYELRCCCLGTEALCGLPGGLWCVRHISLSLEKTLEIRSSERHFCWWQRHGRMRTVGWSRHTWKSWERYCCSLNLCTPQGDAPVSSSLCLEGNFFCRLALKAFQNFTLCVWEYLRTYVISLPPPMLFGDLMLAPEENGREQVIMF